MHSGFKVDSFVEYNWVSSFLCYTIARLFDKSFLCVDDWNRANVFETIYRKIYILIHFFRAKTTSSLSLVWTLRFFCFFVVVVFFAFIMGLTLTHKKTKRFDWK